MEEMRSQKEDLNRINSKRRHKRRDGDQTQAPETDKQAGGRFLHMHTHTLIFDLLSESLGD